MNSCEGFDQLAGHDPFDALNGERVPRWVKGTALGRRVVIQSRKRLPYDLSRLFGIPQTVMAKTVASYATAAGRDVAAGSDPVRLRSLLGCLEATGGALGQGRYGYEFDVQTRWAYYPAGSPNLIVTVFAARAYATALAVDPASADIARERLSDIAAFIADDLVVEGPVPYLRYVPASSTLVHNANLLGCAALVWAGVAGCNEPLLELAARCARSSLDAQEASGRWGYGVGTNLVWCDNFHTAYNLDALLTLSLADPAGIAGEALQRGVSYWAERFFGPAGEPWYYDTGRGPLDIHSAATAVDVGYRLCTRGLVPCAVPEACERWTKEALVNPDDGGTYYQRTGSRLDRRHFKRWGDAHWELACATSRLHALRRLDPLEQLVGGCASVER